MLIEKARVDIIKEFPTNSDRLLQKESYFRRVYSLLIDSKSFLEIGYRKGLFVEICKFLEIQSEHVDISDDLLRAVPSENNKCITSPSLSYLKECKSKFDLIFQDGSKEYDCRKKEYDLIVSGSILKEKGKIIVDDLHYPACKKAFNYAIKRHGFHGKTFSARENLEYKMGLLQFKS